MGNTSRLWRDPSDRALLNTEFTDALLVQDNSWWDGLTAGEKAMIVLVVIVVVVAVTIQLLPRRGPLYD